MIGVLFGLFISIGGLGLGFRCLGKSLDGLDSAAQFGIAGICGLAGLGTVTLFIGLIPGGYRFGLYFLVIPLVAVGWAFLILGPLKKLLKLNLPRKWEWAGLTFIVICVLFALVGVLSPSTQKNDWDSIAYHMAIPKIYLAMGEIHRIPYIHHSNFPSAIELLFVWGLKVGGQAGAKIFLLLFSLFGSIGIFGLSRGRFGKSAGWWAIVAFWAAPTVIWESGSAYIDVAHGLFVGIGTWILALAVESERVEFRKMILAGVLFGFACGTKYTGLETTAIALFVAGVWMFKSRRVQVVKQLGICALSSFLVGGVWYIKNIILVGNPVYPFAFETFGGKDWDLKRATIYRAEQLSFGVGVSPQGKDWTSLGHSILGLGYQPGRYLNPDQIHGGGSPLGAVGLTFFLGLFYWSLVRRGKVAENVVLIFSVLTLVLWFGLSQQSRYITDLMPLSAILVGGAVALAFESKWVPQVLGVLIGLQGGVSLYLDKTLAVDQNLQVAIHSQTREDYLSQNFSFYSAVKDINNLPLGSKVALYDQLFGYYLNIPYFWANPPHCSVIPYEGMHTGDDYVNYMKQNGFTNIYVQFVDPANDVHFAQYLGLSGPPIPMTEEDKSRWSQDWINQWKPLLVEAVQSGKIRLIQGYRSGALFEIEK